MLVLGMADAVDRNRGIGWLHLADLRIGPRQTPLARRDARGVLEQDLRRMHDVAGPWDIVAISGSMTNAGTPAEFDRATEILAWLWSTLRELGSDPVLVVVPGARDRLDVFNAFADQLGPFLRLKNYARTGRFVEDRSVVVDRRELRVGVLGLNTTRAGKSGHLEPEQLAAVCDGDVNAWARRCDAILVVSHHAKPLLDEPSSVLLDNIQAPLVWLPGIHHRRYPTVTAIGDVNHVVAAAPSLSAFEPGRFGYCAGRLTASDDQLRFRAWRRCLANDAGIPRLAPQDLLADREGATSITLSGADSALAVTSAPPSIGSQIGFMEWSPDGERIAAIIGQGTLVIHRRDGVRIAKFPVHASSPCAIAWAPDGKLATRSRFHVRTWTAEGKNLAELYLPCPAPSAMAWLAPDKLLLGAEDGVRIWDVPRAMTERAVDYDESYPVSSILDDVLAFALEPRRTVVEGTETHTPRLAALATQNGIWLLPVAELVRSPRFGQTPVDEPYLPASASPSGAALLAPEAVHIVAWSPSDRILASSGATGVVSVWNIENGNRVARLEGLTDVVRSLSFSRDGRWLAATAIDGSRCLWGFANLATRRITYVRFTRTSTTVVSCSPSADVIALGGMDGIRVEQLPTSDALVLAEDPSDALALAEVRDALALPEEPSVRSASAKVVLLGEGNVGKSCLAMRLTQDRYEEIGSTHGMKFWSVPLERLDPDAEIPPGERREVVFWDMGGQNEYRLLHHAFLHDTMVAVMVMEPRRGEVAMRELDAWERQLTPDRSKIKRILVGSKLDDDRVPRDPLAIDHALSDRGYASYAPTSAKCGLGIAALRKAIADAIDWSSVTVTTRPQLFQRIRSYIDLRRSARRMVIPYHELEDIVKQREGDDVDAAAIGAVVEQLARQGLIADARLADGSRMLILEVEQVERYAASLLLAARDNPRGVPALEMATVLSVDMSFPRIAPHERLPRDQELVILECVVDLLIEAGICLRSGRLLIFPALFRAHGVTETPGAAHSVSVAYDLFGSVDNVYSALVCWLALSQSFGAMRLWPHRVEFARPDSGTSGLHRIVRDEDRDAGRFEIYFDDRTDETTRQFFVGVIDDFLRNHGVELVEQLAMTCKCGHSFAVDDIRHRLAQRAVDIGCQRCDTRIPLVRTGGDALATPGFAAKLRAFRSEALRTRRQTVVEAKIDLDDVRREGPSSPEVCVLHLSDLHISADTDVAHLLQPLCADLEDRVDGLGEHRPDLVMVSGDLTNRATAQEFEVARRFVTELLDRCKLTAERCIVVPGNHDLSWDVPAYRWMPRRQLGAIDPAIHVPQGDGFLVRNDADYPERFRNFAEQFFHPLFQRPYSLVPEEQGQSVLFEDLGIQVLALNSAWQIDEYFPDRSAIHPGALARALDTAERSFGEARRAARLRSEIEVVRLAVWHHPLTGNEKIVNDAFVDQLRRASVRLCLHGHVHEDRADVIGYLHPTRRFHVLGAGSFGAPASERPESTPRLYNLLEFSGNRQSVRVHTRQLRRSGGAWEPWCHWPGANPGERRALYEFDLRATGQ
jgi:WD40 repeat protein/GTPase SAR1 family protein/predicted phosphodiesterase